MPAFGWDELRHDDCHGFVWLATFDNIFDICQQGFNKEAIRRIEDDQPRSFTPSFPSFFNLLGLSRVKRNVNDSYIIGKQLGVAESHQDALMNCADRQDNAMPRLTCR